MKKNISRTPEPKGFRIVKMDIEESPEIVRFVYLDRKLIVINTAAAEDAKYTQFI